MDQPQPDPASAPAPRNARKPAVWQRWVAVAVVVVMVGLVALRWKERGKRAAENASLAKIMALSSDERVAALGPRAVFDEMERELSDDDYGVITWKMIKYGPWVYESLAAGKPEDADAILEGMTRVARKDLATGWRGQSSVKVTLPYPGHTSIKNWGEAATGLAEYYANKATAESMAKAKAIIDGTPAEWQDNFVDVLDTKARWAKTKAAVEAFHGAARQE